MLRRRRRLARGWLREGEWFSLRHCFCELCVSYAITSRAPFKLAAHVCALKTQALGPLLDCDLLERSAAVHGGGIWLGDCEDTHNKAPPRERQFAIASGL